jgi:hypothetical protein
MPMDILVGVELSDLELVGSLCEYTPYWHGARAAVS